MIIKALAPPIPLCVFSSMSISLLFLTLRAIGCLQTAFPSLLRTEGLNHLELSPGPQLYSLSERAPIHEAL